MSRNVKKSRTDSRREQIRRRKREKRIYMYTAIFASLCVFSLAGVIFLVTDGGAGADPEAWIVEGGKIEIAAPPINDSGAAKGAVIVETPGPAIPDFGSIGTEPTAEAEIPAFEIAPEPTALLGADLPTVEPETAISTITITAAGDCTLGGDFNTDAHERFEGFAAEYGYEYFLENVADIFESDDLTFVNLEGPLTTSTDKRGGRTFNFKGDPDNVEILTSASVEVAGLANNHALDFGLSGLKQTAQVLTDAGVGACGYRNVYRTEIKGASVSCLSFTEWDFTIEQLTELVETERANCDLLLVMIHWGEERVYEPTDSQIAYGRALIDAGADLVLGSHSHVVGGIEQYQGKYIVYGLGNFCFGGNANPSDKDAMIFRQTFTVTGGEVSDAGITIIPCATSSKRTQNDYRPTPYTGEEATRVLRKIAGYSDIEESQIKWAKEMEEYFAMAK